MCASVVPIVSVPVLALAIPWMMPQPLAGMHENVELISDATLLNVKTYVTYKIGQCL